MKKKSSILEDPIFQTLVGAIAAMIARITNLVTAGSYQQALEEIDQQLEDLVGLKSEQLLGLNDAFIIDLLTVNEFLDIQRLWYLAELFKAEGDIKAAQGNKPEGLERQVRAMGFFLEAAFASEEIIPQIDEQIASLFSKLEKMLPEDILFNLSDYFDRRKQYKKALDALDRMLEITNNNIDVQAERDRFLNQLSKISDAELISGGLSLALVKHKLSTK